MINKYLCTIVVGLVLFTGVHAQKDLLPKKLEVLRDSASYAMGVSIGQSLSSRYPEMDIDLLLKGCRDAFSGKDSVMRSEAVNAIIKKYLKEQTRIQGIQNREEGERFLKENAKKEGVITTASGLQYIVLIQGTGEKPLPGNRVKVNYVGTLLNGKEFDNSYKRGQPAEFDLATVIKGWIEALQLMPVGSKYKLFIPSELGYGEIGMGSSIPPNSVLVFELELLEIF